MMVKISKLSQIAISWSRMPPYAARSIATGTKYINQPVEIISLNPPDVLQNDVENILEQSINWIDTARVLSWNSLGLNVPNIFFQSGWSIKAFNKLGNEVKQNGGKVICISDNSWKNTPRQWLGALFFRLYYRKYFDAVWVPGISGMQLMKFYGMSENRIYQGLYNADSKIFFHHDSIEKREKKFIFVGQLIERKGVNLLVQAFTKFTRQYPDWKLHIIGSGMLSDKLPKIDNIVYEGFKETCCVAEALRNSRFLILPSHEDHWGLVVHEAALCGCGLILSNAVGSSLDLVGANNGIVFPNNSTNGLYKAMVRAASFNNKELQLISQESKDKASKFSPSRWTITFAQIISDVI